MDPIWAPEAVLQWNAVGTPSGQGLEESWKLVGQAEKQISRICGDLWIEDSGLPRGNFLPYVSS